jgi:tetrahydromethanopterin S-methyltransferase subunit E
MSKTTLTDAPRSQQGIFIVGLIVLAAAVAAALYFLLQLDMPTIFAIVVGLLIAALAIGRFYLVAKHQLFREGK